MASDARRAVTARYRERNREEIRAKGREYQKQYAAENPEKVAESARRYREANPDKVQEWRSRYRERNRLELRRRQAAVRAANPEAQHAKRLRNHHGMRVEDWQAMWDSQDGLCYLCGAALVKGGTGTTVIEHDHGCCKPSYSCRYCRRGLACNNCNVIVGMANDDPDRLRRIADNLEVALRATRERLASKPHQLTLEIEGDGNAA